MDRKDKLIMIVLGFLPFVMVIGNSMFIPILPSIEASMGLTPAEAGLLLTVFSVPAALIIPFISFLADNYGRKKVIMVSLFFVCLGSIISFVSVVIGGEGVSYIFLLIGRAIQGLGAGGTAPLAMAVIGDQFTGKNRSTALGTVEVFNGFGKMMSPFFGIVALMFFWHSAFLFYFLITFVTFLAIKTYILEERTTTNRTMKGYGQDVLQVVRREYSWLLPVFFTGGVILFILFGLLVYLSYEAERVYQVDGLGKGVLFVLPLGAMTIASYLSSQLIGGDNGRTRLVMGTGFGMMLLVLIFGMIEHSFFMLIAILTFFALGAGFILPCCNLFVTSSVSKSERGIVLGLYGMVRFLGVAFGPLVYSQWMMQEWWMFLYSSLLLIGVILWLYIGWLSTVKEKELELPVNDA
ncbi:MULTISPECIES: MFS transporter [Bacillaceae]|uniref:MFS transporter n=1 Tax=Evansella alkalicola TaxID=745819 RepID=A0ABS6JV49_9BACI|nr:MULTISPECIES: MFS transporter [Bacillaceae]MBU9722458.1 MFS transporter [Bacillus alkalicola]